jgi:hypothetical protein
MVQSQAVPMALISGCVTMAPTQLKMFLTKLLIATPLELRRGMNCRAR